jgi:hypothetical protein
MTQHTKREAYHQGVDDMALCQRFRADGPGYMKRGQWACREHPRLTGWSTYLMAVHIRAYHHEQAPTRAREDMR